MESGGASERTILYNIYLPKFFLIQEVVLATSKKTLLKTLIKGISIVSYWIDP